MQDGPDNEDVDEEELDDEADEEWEEEDWERRSSEESVRSHVPEGRIGLSGRRAS